MAKKKSDESKREVIEVIPVGCGFATPSPFHPDGLNDGTAVVMVWNDGKYDIICSYYNESCREDCQILKTIINSKQNEDIEPYELDEDSIEVSFESDAGLFEELSDEDPDFDEDDLDNDLDNDEDED